MKMAPRFARSWSAALILGSLLPLLQSIAAAQSQRSPNPALAAFPINTWQRIAGPAPAPRGIFAYSGGTFDSIHGQFLIFGGGHADYWGNEVCAFSVDTLTWKKMYEPDAKDRYTNDNIDNVRGKLRDSDRPYTRHTYNQLCFVPPTASMFVFGGCGPGWSGIKPNCPTPPDCWSYSFADNKWSLLHAGDGTPTGYARACCYDSKRNIVWAYAGNSQLHGFDLATKTWSAHAIQPDIDFLGTYNYQMAYLPRSDRILLIGGGTCTIDPQTFTAQRRALEEASGKAGVAYLPDRDVILYVTLPGESLDYRMAIFDGAAEQWHDWQTANKPDSQGVLWDRLQYDSANDVALLVGYDGVWAVRLPKKFEFAK